MGIGNTSGQTPSRRIRCLQYGVSIAHSFVRRTLAICSTVFCGGMTMGLMNSGLKSAHMYTTHGDLSSLFSGTMSMTTAPRGRKITLPAGHMQGFAHAALVRCPNATMPANTDAEAAAAAAAAALPQLVETNVVLHFRQHECLADWMQHHQ